MTFFDTPFVRQIVFGDEPPDGYKREFEDRGVWYKTVRGSERWWLIEYPRCEVEPCGGCGRFLPPAKLYSGSFPTTGRNDYDRLFDFRHVCRGCANRHDALWRRLHLSREINSLIRRLEKEITNARRQARAA